MSDSAFLVSIKELENISYRAGQITERISANVKRIGNLDSILTKESATKEELDQFIADRMDSAGVAKVLQADLDKCSDERTQVNMKIAELIKGE